MSPIYLDASATTPLLPEVAEAMRSVESKGYGNPASQHFAGRRARRLVENARETIASIVGARVGGHDDDRVIFTSGGTEANNLALRGLNQRVGRSLALPGGAARPDGTALPGGSCIISAIEHPSVSRVVEQLEAPGGVGLRLPVTIDGVVNAPALADQISPDTRLVSVLHSNHETGILQPVAELAATCAAAGIPMHTDASQSVGKIPVHFRDLGVSAMTISAHKFHGPNGIGALIVRHGVPIEPLHYGGFQQLGLRAGTESVVLAVGMCRALELFREEQAERITRISQLQEQFQRSITSGWPEAVVIGAGSERIPHTVAVAIGGIDRQALVIALDQAGIACSSGSACASGSSEPSATLTAMGCPADMIGCAVRFSFSAVTTPAEIDDASRRILRVCHQLGRQRKG